MSPVRILVGDCRALLRSLPADSVHACVTSPPYFQLRRYLDPSDPLAAQELGSEPTPEAFVANLVDVFREVKRVLHPSGTVWCNLGDSYAGSGKGPTGHNGIQNAETRQGFSAGYVMQNGEVSRGGRKSKTDASAGYKAKDLMLMPFRVAMALQADGWWLRSAIVWAKKAPMPESVTDRPTSAYEMVFLLAKRPQYFYDATAVREKSEWDRENNPDWQHQRAETNAQKHPTNRNAQSGGFTGWQPEQGRNQRNVWHLGPEPYADAHFATFPTEIPRRAILAGTSEKGACPRCLAPWRRITSVEQIAKARNVSPSKYAGGRDERGGTWTAAMSAQTRKSVETLGWQATCGCEAGEPIPCTVLDPFLGSGTTALVADRLGRDAIGLELNPAYAAMARARIESDAALPGMGEVAPSDDWQPLELFGESA